MEVIGVDCRYVGVVYEKQTIRGCVVIEGRDGVTERVASQASRNQLNENGRVLARPRP
jgi:hypothetical protein